MPPPPPFLIWTLRRTGGTTFTRLLHGASGREEVWREPFGRHGNLFGLRRRFVEDRDAARLAEGLEVALSSRPNIKHCFEVCPARFNAVLVRTATRLGYRHLYLDRRDEAARIESLEFARLTGAWGKGQAERLQQALEDGSLRPDPPDAALAERELRRSAVKRQQLFREMKARDTDPFVLFHEDLYTGDILTRFRAAAAYCGITGPLDEAAIAGQGDGRSAQNTAELISAIPGLEAFRARIAAHMAENAGKLENPFLTRRARRRFWLF